MRWLALAMASLLAGCGAAAQTSGQQPTPNSTGPYVHQATGFTFPVTIGNFKRTGITEYNSEKTDVSAGYDEESLATTVYVYPAPSLTAIGLSKSEIDDAQEHLCAQAWQGIQSDITRVHPDAELIAVDQVSSPSLFFTKLGRRAIYLFTGNFRGRVQPLRSEAHLFCYAGQHWLVAFRTTAPASLDYRADLDAVMSGLQWPSSLRR